VREIISTNNLLTNNRIQMPIFIQLFSPSYSIFACPLHNSQSSSVSLNKSPNKQRIIWTNKISQQQTNPQMPIFLLFILPTLPPSQAHHFNQIKSKVNLKNYYILRYPATNVQAYAIYKEIYESPPTIYKWQSAQNEQLYRKTNLATMHSH
jgi:hypothetical protein